MCLQINMSFSFLTSNHFVLSNVLKQPKSVEGKTTGSLKSAHFFIGVENI